MILGLVSIPRAFSSVYIDSSLALLALSDHTNVKLEINAIVTQLSKLAIQEFGMRNQDRILGYIGI